jgi:hypothetical protein
MSSLLLVQVSLLLVGLACALVTGVFSWRTYLAMRAIHDTRLRVSALEQGYAALQPLVRWTAGQVNQPPAPPEGDPTKLTGADFQHFAADLFARARAEAALRPEAVASFHPAAFSVSELPERLPAAAFDLHGDHEDPPGEDLDLEEADDDR